MLSLRTIAALLTLCPREASSFTPTSSHSATSLTPSPSQSLHLRLHDRKTSLNAIPPPHTTPTNNSKNNNNNNQLHLLTFDLDDTIFPIGPVVADANVAQLQTLVKFGYDNAAPEMIIAASKQIRTELREAGDAVITYTELRKQSIRREIERLTSTGMDGDHETSTTTTTTTMVHDSVIEAIFDAWLSERHASADRNLFPHASAALQRIREEHPDAVIGAITNGRGNPLEMPSVASHFDFCISGEDDGVFPRRKPAEGIYKAALSKYNELQGRSQSQSKEDELCSLGWIHVGDDLANDVGASAACGAKSIWFAAEEEDDDELPSWSTATKEELQKRAAMDEVAKQHVSARISSLDELPGAIIEILSR